MTKAEQVADLKMAIDIWEDIIAALEDKLRTARIALARRRRQLKEVERQ